VLQRILSRLTESVDRAEATNPALRRHLHDYRGVLAIFREPRPWTLIAEYDHALRLSREAGDRLMEIAVPIVGPVWGWLDVGNVEGERRRLTAMEDLISSSQEVYLVGWWRLGLASTLAAETDEEAWRKADQVIATMRAQTDGNIVFPLAGQAVGAHLAFVRGHLDQALEEASAAMKMFPFLPIILMPAAAAQMRALMGLGRSAEAVAVAEQVLAALPSLGGAGVFEVNARLAASEAFHAAGDLGRARAELGETLRQIQLRADDITDPLWKNSYLTRNPHCARARRLGRDWGLDAPELDLLAPDVRRLA
jgi:hypothetical protein